MYLLYPVDEGPVYGMCMTGRGDQATLNQWISGLQQNNPILGQVPTLFRLDTGPKELQGAPDRESSHHSPGRDTEREERQTEDEPEVIVEDEPRRSQGIKR